MTKKDLILISIILALGIFIGLMFRGCGNKTVVENPFIKIHYSDSVKIAQLNLKVKSNDSLLKISHNTITTESKTVYRYIQVYHNQHDTLTKIQADTLITDCGELARQSLVNDSLHNSNETMLKAEIGVQSNEIDTCNSFVNDLQKKVLKDEKKIKRNRKIAFVEGLFIIGENAALYFLKK